MVAMEMVKGHIIIVAHVIGVRLLSNLEQIMLCSKS